MKKFKDKAEIKDLTRDEQIEIIKKAGLTPGKYENDRVNQIWRLVKKSEPKKESKPTTTGGITLGSLIKSGVHSVSVFDATNNRYIDCIADGSRNKDLIIPKGSKYWIIWKEKGKKTEEKVI